MYVYLNGKLVHEREATVSVLDRGFMYGDGVFETLRAYGGEVFRLGDHIRRLNISASLIGMEVPHDAEHMAAAVNETLEKNELRDAYVRITLTRGTGPIGLDYTGARNQTFLVVARPFRPYPEDAYEKGISLKTVSVRRNLIEALNPKIKSLNFLNNILAKAEATASGSSDALMLNHKGHITECSASNIFFVRGSTLCTPAPSCGILEGITREVVIELARRNTINVMQGSFTIDYLYGCEEVFITNTTLEIMPVTRVDTTIFRVGQVTRFLRKAFSGATPAGGGK